MPQDPTPPSGLGTPASGQPGFIAPPAASATPSPTPATWAAPDAAARVATPPAGRRRTEPRRGRRAGVAAILAGGLLLIGILSALPLVPTPVATPVPATSASPDVVTVSPAPASAQATTLTSGGGLGSPVAFEGASGSGTLTVTRATWTDAGEATPPQGRRYLVLDLTVACTSGTVPVSPVLLLASAGDAGEFPGFGPLLERPLAGRVLASGEEATGQVGYVVPAGTVQLHLLDEQLHRLASVEVPAP